MEITLEYNVDCASQRMVIVMGEIGICLKREVGQFSSLLPGTVHSSKMLGPSPNFLITPKKKYKKIKKLQNKKGSSPQSAGD
jgi:hypothetical protein